MASQTLFANLTRNLDYTRLAIDSPSETITYDQLLTKSTAKNRLISVIGDYKGIVCLRMSHSALHIETILSLLYLGLPFSPINPSSSSSELEHIIATTKSRYLFSDQKLSIQYRLIYDDNALYVYDLEHSDALKPDCALVVFTSGTTSKPKGVLIGSEALFSNVSGVTSNLNLTHSDKTIVFSPPAYAMAFTQILSHILASACIVPYQHGLKFPLHLLNIAAAANITGLTLSPSFIKLIFAQTNTPPSLTSVRYISTGGMPLYVSDIQLYKYICPNASVINFYGCTENSPRIAHHWIPDSPTHAPSQLIPVGFPIDGVRIKLRAVPGLAACSEILVSGTSLSSGYLNNEALTAQRFINGWYHTGDLGFISNNELYVTGRIDNVFSVSHEKVEPEEVETALNTIPFVEETVVVPQPHELLGNVPVALIKLSDNISVSFEEASASIRLFLQRQLSAYKIPNTIYYVTSLPRTLYGKLDRKAAIALASDLSRES